MHRFAASAIPAPEGTRERVRGAFERSPIPMWIYDNKTHCVLDANDKAVEQYGYTRAQFLAMTLADLAPSLAALDSSAAEPASRPRRTLSHHRATDGTVFTFRLETSGIEVGGRPATLVAAIDITDEENVLIEGTRRVAFRERQYQRLL